MEPTCKVLRYRVCAPLVNIRRVWSGRWRDGLRHRWERLAWWVVRSLTFFWGWPGVEGSGPRQLGGLENYLCPTVSAQTLFVSWKNMSLSPPMLPGISGLQKRPAWQLPESAFCSSPRGPGPSFPGFLNRTDSASVMVLGGSAPREPPGASPPKRRVWLPLLSLEQRRDDCVSEIQKLLNLPR